MKIETWYIEGRGYEGINPPQDGKGNFQFDEVKVILSRQEYEQLLNEDVVPITNPKLAKKIRNLIIKENL